MKRKRVSKEKAEEKEIGACPLYGTQEYWEDRYKRNYKDEKGSSNENDENHDKEHEWYFSYDDLKPLLLPLVLGRQEEEDDWSDTNAEDFEEYVDVLEDENSEAYNSHEATNSDEEESKDDAEEDEGSGDEEVDNADNQAENVDDDFQSLYKESAEKKTPRKVMEIGCGDVPLMDGLVQNLVELESTTKIEATTVVDEIVAFDYSKCVIDVLLERQQKEKAFLSKLKITYLVHDARNLPYKSSTFDVIVDKGTLDAMLSDKEKGKENCIKIISESARLLKFDGYMMIVSHLNANGEVGMEWLNDVLGAGLKAGDNKADYRVEVHGHDDGDEDNLGPAVYIIKKVKMLRDKDDDVESLIDVKFLNY